MKKPELAFTLIELVVVLAVVALLAATLLPALAASAPKVQKITCVNNLKQISFAFRSWEGLHNDRYPMAVSYTQGGASEYLEHGGNIAGDMALSTGGALTPGMVWMVMSNELSTPLVLHCPSDSIIPNHTTLPTNWSSVQIAGIASINPSVISASQVIQSSVSYFVNADATEADPQSIISGDCNIGTTTAGASGAATVRFANAGETTGSAGGGGAEQLATTAYNGTTFWAWTQNDLHQKTGNLLIADGSVAQTTISTLHTYFNNTTNKVEFPGFNFIW